MDGGLEALTTIGLLLVVAVADLLRRATRPQGDVWRERWRQATPVLIRNAPVGVPIRIRGRVCAVREPLFAPLSGRACVAFEALALRETGIVAIRELGAVSFMVEDVTGRALVEVAGAFESRLVDPLLLDRDKDAKRIAAFVARHRQESAILASGCCELAVRPGDQITVLGVGRRDLAPAALDAEYRTRPEQLVIQPGSYGVVCITNSSLELPQPRLAPEG